ncbi:hypothetical protein GCM10025868_38850 [Angustibacter aerolatus]|uniref:N-acetyltransferase domain-containing protein n=1 Tax=Angustibacter aerolatus TaxID=1162965 RepID=A0ABQ6JK45_9ACTN|nr:hypothetical protein [Angustibacter aerolatus]GMA88635.1 hypothetical protein GCM10025868_38850 [Angustibacter aerolatus]
MVLRGDPRPVPDGVGTRVLDPDDADVPAAEVVPHLAFGAGIGTAVGDSGVDARDEAVLALDPEREQGLRDRLRSGAAVRAVAWIEDVEVAEIAGLPGVLAAGGLQRAEGVAEVVGVGTLPAARRRGLAAGVTSALAEPGARRGRRGRDALGPGRRRRTDLRRHRVRAGRHQRDRDRALGADAVAG